MFLTMQQKQQPVIVIIATTINEPVGASLKNVIFSILSMMFKGSTDLTQPRG